MKISEALQLPDYPDKCPISIASLGHGGLLTCIEETDREAYLSYRARLTESGFVLAMENGINGNLFATYTDRDTLLHIYYAAYDHTVRLFKAPLCESGLPPHFSQPSFLKTHESSITQMILNYYDRSGSTHTGNYGNCYVMVLADGSLMIYDGGGMHGSTDGDVERLWALMQELGAKAPDGKIRIAAWFITHEHQDHIWCAYKVLDKYASQLALEAVYCNTVADEVRSYTDSSWRFVEGEEMKALQSKYGNRVKIIRVHTGQKFWVRNAQIEILFTPEDMYPRHIKSYTDFNDSSVISRITVDGINFLMTGDAGRIGSETVCSMYGEALKSDVCQIAHHGYGYTLPQLYEYANAGLYMLPTLEGIFRGILNGTSNVLRYGPSVREIIERIVLQVGENNVLRADHNNKTFVFSTKEIVIRKTNNDQPGYPYGDKNTNPYR